jgi:uncharacterized protein YjbJ (UPF0337 family)
MRKKESVMNSDRLQGQWKQLKGKVKTKWGKLTDDDLDVIDGQTDLLIGKIQERYGIQKEAAQRQVEEWNKILAQDDAERDRELRRAS